MKKTYILLLITGTLLCMYLVSCTEKVYEIEAREATKEIEKAVLVTSEPHEEKPILTTSFSSSNFYDPENENNAIGGGENPFREAYGMSVSGFLMIPDTFTNIETYYSEEEQRRFNAILDEYSEMSRAGEHRLPMMVYLIREMPVSRNEFIHYLEAVGASYSDETLDIIFSDDDDLINETFRSPLTVYQDGFVYTVPELRQMTKEKLDTISTEQLEQLTDNIRAFTEAYPMYDTKQITDFCSNMELMVQSRQERE